jgi:hypothetical protein
MRVSRRARDATAGLTVTRLASNTGVITFAATTYPAGHRWANASIEVTIVAGSVQLSKDGKVIRIHPIRHDRARELGAFANPKGDPGGRTQPLGMSPRYRNSSVPRYRDLTLRVGGPGRYGPWPSAPSMRTGRICLR